MDKVSATYKELQDVLRDVQQMMNKKWQMNDEQKVSVQKRLDSTLTQLLVI